MGVHFSVARALIRNPQQYSTILQATGTAAQEFKRNPSIMTLFTFLAGECIHEEPLQTSTTPEGHSARLLQELRASIPHSPMTSDSVNTANNTATYHCKRRALHISDDSDTDVNNVEQHATLSTPSVRRKRRHTMPSTTRTHQSVLLKKTQACRLHMLQRSLQKRRANGSIHNLHIHT